MISAMNDNAPAPLAPASGAAASTIWHDRLDRAGATASFLCAIHCLLAPVLAATAAAGALLFFHRELEALFVYSSLALGAWSLGWGFLHHRKATVLVLYVLAAAGFLTAIYWVHGTPAELPAMVSGGLLLAAGHLLNRRFLAAH